MLANPKLSREVHPGTKIFLSAIHTLVLLYNFILYLIALFPGGIVLIDFQRVQLNTFSILMV